MSDDTETRPPQSSRFSLRSAALTLTVVAGAGAAVVAGSDLLADRADAAAVYDTAELIPVSVTPLTLSEGYSRARAFIGQVEAGASVPMSFELGGRLSALLVDEGALVAAGDVLARLDTALLEAEAARLTAAREATAAQLVFAETRVTRASALRAEGFASQETLDSAIATRDELAGRIRETDAALDSVAINLEKSVLVAPFDGRVGLRNVDGGETLGAGAPVLTLIETGTPQVRVGLPLSLSPEVLETAEIEIDGTAYPARLVQVRPDIDPVTRTRTAIFDVETDTAPAIGQTAVLRLETEVAAVGTWVPLDAMQESLGGAWSILVVEDGIVRIATVEVLHAEATRAYVQGSFAAGVPMIATGAQRVVPGQQVRVLTEAE